MIWSCRVGASHRIQDVSHPWPSPSPFPVRMSVRKMPLVQGDYWAHLIYFILVISRIILEEHGELEECCWLWHSKRAWLR